MGKNTKSKKKIERLFRIDFNTFSREIIEVYEVSPEGSQGRTGEGWTSAYRQGIITQRPPRGGFMTEDQIEKAVMAEQELLREKKHKLTAAYLVAEKYPIREWLRDE